MLELLTIAILIVGLGGGYLWGELVDYVQKLEDRKRIHRSVMRTHD